MSSSLTFEPSAELFWLSALHMRINNLVFISVDLTFFVLLYNESFMNNLKLNDYYKN